MLQNISSLEPSRVFAHFLKICSIPHPSGHLDGMADYLLSFAAEHKLQAVKDECGNVIIDKPATAGKEHSPLVILQAHQDMVPVAVHGKKHDFKTDPITPVIKADGFMYADGTTLGADDGIGMAYALSVLEDPTLSHGPLRAIFTVDEETSMKGAAGLDPKYLQGTYLINLDSEDTGFAFVAAAGSQDVVIKFAGSREKHEDLKAVRLDLQGLTGGHSGTDIHIGRASAIRVMAGMLAELTEETDFLYLQNLKSGFVRNAIASSASFEVAVPAEDMADFKQACLLCFEKFRELYRDTDPNMQLKLTECEAGEVFSFEYSMELIALLLNVPHGEVRRFQKDPSIVETSSNLGLVSTEGDTVTIVLLLRSLNSFALDELTRRVEFLCFLNDKCDLSAPHCEPCWESPSDNELIARLKDNYHAVTGSELKISAIHAGLETATFSQKNPQLQLVSIGPTVQHPHSPSERVSIEGVGVMYETLRRTLGQL